VVALQRAAGEGGSLGQAQADRWHYFDPKFSPVNLANGMSRLPYKRVYGHGRGRQGEGPGGTRKRGRGAGEGAES
jgi:hypothetical protein